MEPTAEDSLLLICCKICIGSTDHHLHRQLHLDGRPGCLQNAHRSILTAFNLLDDWLVGFAR